MTLLEEERRLRVTGGQDKLGGRGCMWETGEWHG